MRRLMGFSLNNLTLMALTIAVVKQCDGFLAYHAKAAARRGAPALERGGARRAHRSEWVQRNRVGADWVAYLLSVES